MEGRTQSERGKKGEEGNREKGRETSVGNIKGNSINNRLVTLVILPIKNSAGSSPLLS